ncbi:MAG: ACP S-malonyltransferase [Phycisphaerae bacterium]|nr:ACP S-malonyltransferase [Phycisphaerae bacterium]
MSQTVLLCPGQGAQAVGMGTAWAAASSAARAIIETADRAVSLPNGAALSAICAQGPLDLLSRTDISQPALYTVGVACAAAMRERAPLSLAAAAGLSLGEYTALHLAGSFSFEDGLRLVSLRGRFMQDAAEASQGGMVALIGADEEKALEVCSKAAQGDVLVCANFNAPGQIVLSGHATACDRAVTVAGDLGLRAAKLVVAGAFHSPLMQPAAERLAKALDETAFAAPSCPVWSNVTARPHGQDTATIKRLLVEQLTAPVRWSQSCTNLIAAMRSGGTVVSYREVAPGSVLKGLMKRIDRTCEVTSHDQPDPVAA